MHSVAKVNSEVAVIVLLILCAVECCILGGNGCRTNMFLSDDNAVQ